MRAAAGFPLLGAAGVLTTVSLFFGGGSGDERLFWIGMGTLFVALVAGAASLLGGLPRPAVGPAGIAFLALLTAFVAWTGISIWWSIVPDRSWNYLDRGLVYLAFGAVGLLLGAAVSVGPRLLAAWLAGGRGAA